MLLWPSTNHDPADATLFDRSGILRGCAKVASVNALVPEEEGDDYWSDFAAAALGVAVDEPRPSCSRATISGASGGQFCRDGVSFADGAPHGIRLRG